MINIFIMPKDSDIFILCEGKEYYFDNDGNRSHNMDFPSVEKWRMVVTYYGDQIDEPYFFLTTNTFYERIEEFYEEFPEFLL